MNRINDIIYLHVQKHVSSVQSFYDIKPFHFKLPLRGLNNNAV